MPFKKGQKRPARAGRKKGTPNKATATVKEALTQAFDGLGGVPSLINWARRNRAEFYRLWGRMLPAEINAKHSGGIGLTVEQVTDDELDRRIAEAERRLAALTDGANPQGGEGGVSPAGSSPPTDQGGPGLADAQCGPATGSVAGSVGSLDGETDQGAMHTPGGEVAGGGDESPGPLFDQA